MKDLAYRLLTENIMPYWLTRVVQGDTIMPRIDGNDRAHPEAELGSVLVARMLWAFSAACRVVGREEYRNAAATAKRVLLSHLYDTKHGGVYWSTASHKKQIYALGFAIYGLAEYVRATNDYEARHIALDLFHDIERHSRDRQRGGYYEAFDEEWNDIADMRLSEHDANERKTMNTHLHIIEPYVNLYRVSPTPELREAIVGLLHVFLDHIVDPDTGHLHLFFDDDWHCHDHVISYGHDIEASWLLHEAVLVLDDHDLRRLVEPVVQRIAEAAAEGLLPQAGMMYELHTDTAAIDADRHWWVQAETVVGYYNIYQHYGDPWALRSAEQTLRFIDRHIVDHNAGEWHWSLRADGTLNRDDDKAGFWKCPYHNTRMCIELLERIK